MKENIKLDYEKFKIEIQKSSRKRFKIDESNESSLKRNHHNVYVIALILTKLQKDSNDDNKIAFFSELLSDILTSNKLAILGYVIPSLILLRRAIENFYYHFYFLDHPVEFYHLNKGKNEYTPIEEHKKYLESHPIFLENKDELIKEFNDMLFDEYHKLCRIVHSKGTDYMNLANGIDSLVSDFKIEDYLKKIISVETWIIYLAYKFHRSLKYTSIEKKYVSECIPKAKREHLHE